MELKHINQLTEWPQKATAFYCLIFREVFIIFQLRLDIKRQYHTTQYTYCTETSSDVKLACVFFNLYVGGDVCLYRNTFIMRDV
jgi:hypothetical protein